ncbi:TPA: hypothetical protein OQU49_004305 [Shigella flexneri]|nr:hypothetical protein [Shigella flexneri]
MPSRPRTWDVSWGARDGGELAKLEAFASGAWGYGPWHWVSVAAQLGNVLTPRESVFLDRAGSSYFADAGPVRDSSGEWSPRSVGVALDAGWASLFRDVPVVAGKWFTWSADVSASTTAAPQLQVAFYDGAGSAIAGAGGTSAGVGVGMQRVSGSWLVPVGAVEARVGVRSTVGVVARPQVTWTDKPVPFSAGHGCRSAVVDGVSSDLLVVNSGGPVSSVGFTVLEVG